ncbi:MAG: S-layer homology domain-containing protein [Armatimonadota bacterium]|nr:S-layer homology domain-containing protein [Armatimonadota bacterium]
MRTQRWILLLLLVGLLALPAGAELFTDIKGIPAQRSIERVGALGVIKGTPDGKFLPDAPVTRLDLVVILVRALGLSTESKEIPSYKDIQEIPQEARPYVAAILSVGIASPSKAEVRKGGIVYTLVADKTIYNAGEEVNLTFTITNTTSEIVKFEFANGQEYDFIIRQDGQEIARWSLGKAFTEVEKTLPLAPGKSFQYTTKWRQLDQNDRPVEPGRYEIIAVHTTKTNPTSVSLVFQKGLIAGYPDGTFRPRQEVTRAELAAVVLRALGLEGEALAKKDAALPFADGAAIQTWARGYVAVAVERKILLPFADQTIRAHAPATRADVAVAVDQLMERLSRYEYVRGTVEAVRVGRPSTITIKDPSGAVRTYRVATAVAIYRNGQPVELGALKPGDEVAMLLAARVAGDATYIEAKGP